MGNLIRYIAQEDPEKELQNEKYSHRNFIESYVPQTPRRQQQTPTPWSEETLRRSTIPKRPKYTTPNPKPIPTADIIKSGLEGFGQGIENGSLSLFNAGTGGLYNIVSYFLMNNDYEKRQERMQRQAENAGLGGINKLANYAIEIGGKTNVLKKIITKGAKSTTKY